MASSSGCIAELNNGMKKIFRAQDVREDTELKMRAYANWGEFLVPGPMSIEILGELVFISANNDFAINRHTPGKTFTHIKHPESFRACLMQVCNEGWKAFNTAHTNMDKIRLLSLNIPNEVKVVVQTLMQQDKAIVETLLPLQLKQMKDISTKCLSLAEKVEDDFQGILQLISELLENCTSAKSAHKESLKKVTEAIKYAELKRKNAEMAKEMADKYHKEVNKQVEESQLTYMEAVNSRPGTSQIIALAVTDAVVKVATALPNWLNKESTNSETQQTQKASQSPESDPIAMMNIASKAGYILNLSQSLLDFVSKDKIDMTKLRDQKTSIAQSNGIREQLKNIAASLEKENDCEVKEPALNLCKKGERICDSLQKKLGKSCTQEDIPKAMHDLVERAREFDLCCNNLTHTAPLQLRTPNASKAKTGPISSESILTSAIQSSHMAIEQSKEQLRDSRAEYHKSFENLKKCTQEFDGILNEMRKLTVEKVDFETTLKMLIKGLEALGNVREQWTKIVQFFQMTTNLIDTCLNVNISKFVNRCESISDVPGYQHLDFIKDMLYGPAFQASNFAHLVHMISETYVQVSNKYLMDRLSNLTTLMSLEPDSFQFKEAQNELRQGCQEATNRILELVQRNREEFDQKIDDRIECINRNLKAVLPALSREEQKAIENTVQKKPQALLKEISAADADQFC